MKVFQDENGCETTDEFYNYFEENYSVHMRGILEQMRRDLSSGINALAIIDHVYSRLWSERMMFHYCKPEKD